MRRSHIAAALFGAAFVALLVGIYFSGAIPGLAPAAEPEPSNAPSPPCPRGWAEHPRDAICMRTTENCYTLLNGVDSRAVACTAESQDGKVFLQTSTGFERGSAVVRVFDAAGKRVFERTFSTPFVGNFDLSGAPGKWRLETDFKGTAGSAKYTLWG